MLSYVTIGTNNLENALKFFDPLMKELGATRFMETPRGVFYGNGKGPMLAVMTPFDGEAASFGNGTMVALNARSPEEVDRLHALALNLGAQDEGAPGIRLDKFYLGYFRDLDGNKFSLFSMPKK